jgi:hypothetical protein
MPECLFDSFAKPQSTVFDRLKAGLLCLLILVAATPKLHAQSQCATPYETNCVVTIGPVGCGNGGVIPCWIKYDLTVTDDTPNAVIHYDVALGPYPIDHGYMASGEHIIETETFGEEGFGLTMNGTTYATATGYAQSNTISLSF